MNNVSNKLSSKSTPHARYVTVGDHIESLHIAMYCEPGLSSDIIRYVPSSRMTNPTIGAASTEGFAFIANFNSSIRDSLAGLKSLLLRGSMRQLTGSE